MFDLQRSTEIEITLREGNHDSLFAERGIDGEIDVADHPQTPVDIVNDGAQLKVEEVQRLQHGSRHLLSRRRPRVR